MCRYISTPAGRAGQCLWRGAAQRHGGRKGVSPRGRGGLGNGLLRKKDAGGEEMWLWGREDVGFLLEGVRSARFVEGEG